MRESNVPVERAKELTDMTRAVNDEIRVGVINCLANRNEAIEIVELREDIADWLGKDRKRTHTSLLHQHIPKLEKYDVVRSNGDTVRKGPKFDAAYRVLAAFMD